MMYATDLILAMGSHRVLRFIFTEFRTIYARDILCYGQDLSVSLPEAKIGAVQPGYASSLNALAQELRWARPTLHRATALQVMVMLHH